MAWEKLLRERKQTARRPNSEVFGGLGKAPAGEEADDAPIQSSPAWRSSYGRGSIARDGNWTWPPPGAEIASPQDSGQRKTSGGDGSGNSKP